MSENLERTQEGGNEEQVKRIMEITENAEELKELAIKTAKSRILGVPLPPLPVTTSIEEIDRIILEEEIMEEIIQGKHNDQNRELPVMPKHLEASEKDIPTWRILTTTDRKKSRKFENLLKEGGATIIKESNNFILLSITKANITSGGGAIHVRSKDFKYNSEEYFWGYDEVFLMGSTSGKIWVNINLRSKEYPMKIPSTLIEQEFPLFGEKNDSDKEVPPSYEIISS